MKVGNNVTISNHLFGPELQKIENGNTGIAPMQIDYINKANKSNKLNKSINFNNNKK